MRTKGTAFIARRAAIVEEFGEARWSDFVESYRATDKLFAQPILATTLMPTDRFLAFNDRLVDVFYGGDRQVYWKFGEKAAQWVLTSGPYKQFVSERGVERFARRVPQIWSGYHDAGECGASVLEGDAIEIFAREVPIHHPYFELGLVGFLQRGFELVTRRAHAATRLLGFSRGDAEVRYRLTPVR